jgi:hypothetical protein
MEQITVALIGVVGAVIVTLLEKARRENKQDHGFVAAKLDDLKISLISMDEDLAHIEAKIDTHIHDHVTGAIIQEPRILRSKKNGSKKVR